MQGIVALLYVRYEHVPSIFYLWGTLKDEQYSDNPSKAFTKQCF